MDETYDVLMDDGSVVQYAAGQFAEIREARSPKARGALVAEGWIPLTERVETGPAPQAPSAVEEALGGSVLPPAEAPSLTIYVLGRLKPGSKAPRSSDVLYIDRFIDVPLCCR